MVNVTKEPTTIGYSMGESFLLKYLYKLNFGIISFLIFLFPLYWLPYIHHHTLRSLRILLIIIFILITALYIVFKKEFKFFITPTLFLVVVFSLLIFVHFFFTHFLYILFGFSVVYFVIINPKLILKIFPLFTVWLGIIAIYSLLVTYSNVPSFEPVEYPGGGIPYSQRWENPIIKPNTFGFFPSQAYYVPLGVGLIFSTIYYLKYNSTRRKLLYLVMIAVFLLNLLNIIILTDGAGRAGLLPPLILLSILAIMKFDKQNYFVLLIYSPIVFWILIYLLYNFDLFQDILIRLNDYTSRRITLFIDSIEVMLSNHLFLHGLGGSPWGEFTLSEFGVSNALVPSWRSHLTRPHNQLMEIVVQYGLLAGGLIVFICIRISKLSSSLLNNSISAEMFSIIIILNSWIFVGFLFGGKVGPYALQDSSMLFWWTCFGIFVGTSIKCMNPDCS